MTKFSGIQTSLDNSPHIGNSVDIHQSPHYGRRRLMVMRVWRLRLFRIPPHHNIPVHPTIFPQPNRTPASATVHPQSRSGLQNNPFFKPNGIPGKNLHRPLKTGSDAYFPRNNDDSPYPSIAPDIHRIRGTQHIRTCQSHCFNLLSDPTIFYRTGKGGPVSYTHLTLPTN